MKRLCIWGMARVTELKTAVDKNANGSNLHGVLLLTLAIVVRASSYRSIERRQGDYLTGEDGDFRVLQRAMKLLVCGSCFLSLLRQAAPAAGYTPGLDPAPSANLLDSLCTLSVIPVPTRTLLSEEQYDGQLVPQPMPNSAAASCPQVLTFELTYNQAGVRLDTPDAVTQVFVGDVANDRIILHAISQTLAHTQTALPISYGVVWAAEDLDRDGDYELVLQGGDTGFGGDGWIDIYSSPDWVQRAHIVFEGMKVEMFAAPVNVDDDSVIELFVSPQSLGGSAKAVVIDFDSLDDQFVIRSQCPSPTGSGGRPAIADFDLDGRQEFISGYDYGYSLFEWQDTLLVHVGHIGDSLIQNNFWACTCRPLPGGAACALLGHSGGPEGFLYELLTPAGDNLFQSYHRFSRETGWTGVHPSFGLDVDCDGLDELAMCFYPDFEVWEWDTQTEQFQPGCAWASTAFGTLRRWFGADVNNEGAMEWITINHLQQLSVFESDQCIGCDSTGQCIPTTPCGCSCHGDPTCDGIIADVRDVIFAVDVAFRGGVTLPEYSPFCGSQRTDANCDGVTDVADVVRIIEVAFRGGDAATQICDPCSQTRLSLQPLPVNGQSLAVTLRMNETAKAIS